MKHGFQSFLRKRVPLAAFVGILLLLSSAKPDAAEPKNHPIRFKPGQTKAYTSGRFTKMVHEVYFSFHGTAGQHLLVQITPTTAELITAGTVVYPSGMQDGGPGGIVFDSDLIESGQYQLRVSERQSEMKGGFRVLVELRSPKNDGIENKR